MKKRAVLKFMVIDGTCYLRGLVTGGHGGERRGAPLLIKISTSPLKKNTPPLECIYSILGYLSGPIDLDKCTAF